MSDLELSDECPCGLYSLSQSAKHQDLELLKFGTTVIFTNIASTLMNCSVDGDSTKMFIYFKQLNTLFSIFSEGI